MGKKLGDAGDPLLVSVRSGAKFSMPGMMDTILNLGLNDRSVEGLKARTGNGRFAKDSYRRFIQMFGNVVLGIDKDKFEHELHAVKRRPRWWRMSTSPRRRSTR
jgi:pyruvate,orthophosphate dikinase